MAKQTPLSLRVGTLEGRRSEYAACYERLLAHSAGEGMEEMSYTTRCDEAAAMAAKLMKALPPVNPLARAAFAGMSALAR